MVIQTELDFLMRDICLPTEVISMYPNHEMWVAKCMDEHRTVFLIKNQEKNIGCAIVKVSRKYPKMLKLCYLYVIPDYRNRGYGSAIISAVEKYTKEHMMEGVYVTANPNAENMEKCLLSNLYFKIGMTNSADIVFQHLLLDNTN